MAKAPKANSSCPGTPSLRTIIKSNGAFIASEIIAATGTPPRGSARTMTSFRFA